MSTILNLQYRLFPEVARVLKRTMDMFESSSCDEGGRVIGEEGRAEVVSPQHVSTQNLKCAVTG